MSSKKKPKAKKSKSSKPVRPVGRPSDYNPKFCKMLIDHLSKGYSFESFGAVAHCAKQTLYTWCEEHEEFMDAKNIGLGYSRLHWEKEGHKGMWGGKAFNPAVWIFSMRNRFGWRDNQKEEEQEPEEITFVRKKLA